MPPSLSLQADELRRFSVPLTVRLVGERQDAVGAGSLVIATDMRLIVEVDETPEPFALNYVRQPGPSESGRPLGEAARPGGPRQRRRRWMAWR